MASDKIKYFREVHPDTAILLANLHLDRHPISICLDGIHDIQNVGAIFRLGDAARLAQILSFYDGSIFPEKKLERLSRSTNRYVPFQKLHNLQEVQTLKQTHTFVALEITNQSIAYFDWKPVFPLVIVAGSEQSGVSQELLDLTDHAVHIPMYGVNLSMNVAMATSIFVYYCLEFLKSSTNS